jgi:luciferase family oxidoreductase group 1
MAMKVSILDAGFVPPGENSSQVLRDIVRSAPVIESLGYSRLWLAEHYERHFAYACPEILIPAVASATTHLRVGSAGVLMNFHSPLRIASAFRMLEAMYPGRIDLGVASGFAGTPNIQQALRHGFDQPAAIATQLYRTQVEELVAWLRDEVPQTDPRFRLPTPAGGASPPLIFLGAGYGVGNLSLAARYGEAFCYSLAHGKTERGPEIVARYRSEFRPVHKLDKPFTMVAATVACAETNRDAARLLTYFRWLDGTLTARVRGRPELCRRQMEEIFEQYQCDELVLIPLYDSFEERMRGLTLLAEVCGLAVTAPGPERMCTAAC